MVISALVIAVIGFFLVQQITSGLLANERKAALTQTSSGLAIAQARPDVLGSHVSAAAVKSLVDDLQADSGPGNVYDVVILQQHASPGLAGVVGNPALVPSIPRKLSALVMAEQRRGRSDRLYYAPTELMRTNGQPAGPALAVGVPITSHDQLYYLFPLIQQQQALSLIQTTIISAGVVLIVLLAGIVSLVTRWVVVPLRQAAQAASGCQRATWTSACRSAAPTTWPRWPTRSTTWPGACRRSSGSWRSCPRCSGSSCPTCRTNCGPR